MKIFLAVFAVVFLAELGDKTQLATQLYAADSKNPGVMVFIAAAAALLLAAALTVFLGSVISRFINPKYLSLIAGIGFIVIGIWTIIQAA